MAIAPRRQAQQRQGSRERRELMQGSPLHQQQQSGRGLSVLGVEGKGHEGFLSVAWLREPRRNCDKFAAYIPEWSNAPPHRSDPKTEIGPSTAAQKDPWATTGETKCIAVAAV